MRTIVICVLALASLAYGLNGIRQESNDGLKGKNPYVHLFRTRRIVQVCTPGSLKQEDCNSCFCIGDGSGWACTEMACPPNRPNPNPVDPKPVMICRPGTSRIVECNNCRCSPDGTAELCTRMVCPEHTSTGSS